MPSRSLRLGLFHFRFSSFLRRRQKAIDGNAGTERCSPSRRNRAAVRWALRRTSARGPRRHSQRWRRRFGLPCRLGPSCPCSALNSCCRARTSQRAHRLFSAVMGAASHSQRPKRLSHWCQGPLSTSRFDVWADQLGGPSQRWTVGAGSAEVGAVSLIPREFASRVSVVFCRWLPARPVFSAHPHPHGRAGAGPAPTRPSITPVQRSRTRTQCGTRRPWETGMAAMATHIYSDDPKGTRPRPPSRPMEASALSDPIQVMPRRRRHKPDRDNPASP